MNGRRSRERGLRTIVVYKLVRGGSSLAVALTMLAATVTGHTGAIAELLRIAREHTAAGAIGVVSDRLAMEGARGVALWATGLVAVDGALSLFEGWALVHGWWWGPWVVVILTTAFIPVEVASIARHPSAPRLVLLIVNVGVAAYLAWWAMRHHRAIRTQRRA